MSEKRRDKKGRILQTGERQRSDGMYEYRYVDASGVKRSVYSWLLVPSDKAPSGKRATEALRDMERRIARDLADGINEGALGKQTLNEAIESYYGRRNDIRPATRRTYSALYRLYVRDTIGSKPVTKICFTDILGLYTEMLLKRGLSRSTVQSLDTMMKPVFNMYVRAGAIRSSPLNGVMRDVSRMKDKAVRHRNALTKAQQDTLLNYCVHSKVFASSLPMIIFLLGTGCRYGEATALTWDDCDFDAGSIRIHRTLSYLPDENGRCKWMLGPTKTAHSTRVIPMIEDVKRVLLDIKASQELSGKRGTEVDGVMNFVFLNSNGNNPLQSGFDMTLKSICDSYNRIETTLAAEQHRQPNLLPRISAHIFRHTFCVRLCENGVDIKIVQELMGHASIGVTMDIYNEATLERKQSSLVSIGDKLSLNIGLASQHTHFSTTSDREVM